MPALNDCRICVFVSEKMQSALFDRVSIVSQLQHPRLNCKYFYSCSIGLKYRQKNAYTVLIEITKPIITKFTIYTTYANLQGKSVVNKKSNRC